MDERTCGRIFVEQTQAYLGEVYLQRLKTALDVLPMGFLWRRPHKGSISVGTILQHLEGNIRQWVLAGVGSQDDTRQRSREFSNDGSEERPGEREDLFAALESTAREAAAQIADLDEMGLQRRLVIQGFEVSCLEALYHVVEHFSWHVGQVVWIAKARAGEGHGIAFYDDDALENGSGPSVADDS